MDVGRKVIECRARNHRVIMIGGRGIHPVGAVPGGWSKPVSADERRQIASIARDNVEFALFSLRAFDDIVLGNQAYVDLRLSDTYLQPTYSRSPCRREIGRSPGGYPHEARASWRVG